jgi:hypothetical protein
MDQRSGIFSCFISFLTLPFEILVFCITGPKPGDEIGTNASIGEPWPSVKE